MVSSSGATKATRTCPDCGATIDVRDRVCPNCQGIQRGKPGVVGMLAMGLIALVAICLAALFFRPQGI